MPTLTLKNVSDTLLKRLRKLAGQQRRSLTQQALYLIEGGLAEREPETAEQQASAQVSAWRDLAGRWVSDQTAQEEINNVYAARSEGRKVDL